MATRAPAAAATKAAVVEMLKVCELVAAGAAGVHEVLELGRVDLGGELAHHRGRGGDLGDRLGLHVQAHEDGRELHRA